MKNKKLTAIGIFLLYFMWYVIFNLFKGIRFQSLTILETTLIIGTICLVHSLLTKCNWGIIYCLINNNKYENP
jgi:hypothetical protein